MSRYQWRQKALGRLGRGTWQPQGHFRSSGLAEEFGYERNVGKDWETQRSCPLGVQEVAGERFLASTSPHHVSLGPDNRNLNSSSLQAPALQGVRVVS